MIAMQTTEIDLPLTHHNQVEPSSPPTRVSSILSEVSGYCYLLRAAPCLERDVSHDPGASPLPRSATLCHPAFGAIALSIMM